MREPFPKLNEVLDAVAKSIYGDKVNPIILKRAWEIFTRSTRRYPLGIDGPPYGLYSLHSGPIFGLTPGYPLTINLMKETEPRHALDPVTLLMTDYKVPLILKSYLPPVIKGSKEGCKLLKMAVNETEGEKKSLPCLI